jgi:hypothetical protein
METDDRASIEARRNEVRERVQRCITKSEAGAENEGIQNRLLRVIALTLYAREFLK